MGSVVIGVDSTLIQNEVIDVLASLAGCADGVANVIAVAVRSELDFVASLRERRGLLAGLEAGVLDEVRPGRGCASRPGGSPPSDTHRPGR
jgi:phosphoserine phosphatase